MIFFGFKRASCRVSGRAAHNFGQGSTGKSAGASGDLANDGPSENYPRVALVPNFAPLPIDMDYVD